MRKGAIRSSASCLAALLAGSEMMIASVKRDPLSQPDDRVRWVRDDSPDEAFISPSPKKNLGKRQFTYNIPGENAVHPVFGAVHLNSRGLIHRLTVPLLPPVPNPNAPP